MFKRSFSKIACIAAISLVAAGLLIAEPSDGSGSAIQPGTIYTRNSAGEEVIAYNAGHTYALNKDGQVTISYNNGKLKAQAPLTLYASGHEESGLTVQGTGFFISTDKTAIVYGGARGLPVQVLITNNQGKTWNSYPVTKELTGTTKNIGFLTKNDGWMMLSKFYGMGREEHDIYKTKDGGKTWSEVKGNANEVYARVLTGAGFANDKIGFMGFRYETDFQPAVTWTQDGGKTWAKLHVKLPDNLLNYSLTPLSPVFNGAKGQFPIQLSKDGASNVVGTAYLTSSNYGKTWKYHKVVMK
ncbi:WD40/YVTN/BNR-like repeat-containing protein [Paenibacillus sp. BAC0078]